MNIALCYDRVFPARGGCATYITDLARCLVADGHEVHPYACAWEAAALPATVQYHPLPTPHGPRFQRPWRFAAACEEAIRAGGHQVSVGFDKTWGQDVLYPQGGLHLASVAHNLHKFPGRVAHSLARLAKWLDLAHWSFAALERRQYLGRQRPLIIVNSVQFLGPRRDMLYCYFAADFLVHPTFYDPCSLVVLEARACGLPVITSCYNGASELLSPPHDGYVIDDPHNHAQLAACIEQ